MSNPSVWDKRIEFHKKELKDEREARERSKLNAKKYQAKKWFKTQGHPQEKQQQTSTTKEINKVIFNEIYDCAYKCGKDKFDKSTDSKEKEDILTILERLKSMKGGFNKSSRRKSSRRKSSRRKFSRRKSSRRKSSRKKSSRKKSSRRKSSRRN